MIEQHQIGLARYRMSKAKEKIRAAEILLESSAFEDSVSRSYYAILMAARALLALKGLDSRKHSGVISLFNRHFVKEGLMDRTASRIIQDAKGEREEADYGDYKVVTEDEAMNQLA